MTDLQASILAAWQRIKPALLADPTDLARRLARRRTPTLLRPPRAWCLAMRANDTRINPYNAILFPEYAMEAKLSTSHRRCRRMLPHRVTVDAPLMRQLTQPVCIRCEDWREAAKLLGTTGAGLQRSRLRAVFSQNLIPLLRGKPGKPVPVLSSSRPLDPQSGHMFEHADPVWGTTTRWLRDHVPSDLQQTLNRVPKYRTMKPRHGEKRLHHFDGWRWLCPRCGRRVRILYYPLPASLFTPSPLQGEGRGEGRSLWSLFAQLRRSILHQRAK
jgi:hypothetical protein